MKYAHLAPILSRTFRSMGDTRRSLRVMNAPAGTENGDYVKEPAMPQSAVRGSSSVKYFILGPLEISVGGIPIPLPRPRERRALAALLLDVNRSVSTDRIAEALWDGAPPPTAQAQIRNVLTALRQHLALVGGSAPICRTGAGFVLRAGAGQLDLEDFEAEITRGGEFVREGRLAAASVALRRALALWRGAALDGMDGRMLDAEAYRLEEQRLVCLEQCIEIDLALGRHREIAGEVAGLVEQYPLREHLVELLMIALYRSGRRQDALTAFAAARDSLRQTIGLDPRPELVALQEAILRGDTSERHRVPQTDSASEFARLKRENELLRQQLATIRSALPDARTGIPAPIPDSESAE